MTPISARSRRPVSVSGSMLSSRARASSVVSTGVLPFFTTYFGPRTAWAGIVVDDVAGHQPVEQHAQRGQVLLHRGRGELALQLLHEGGDVERLHVGELRQAVRRAPWPKRRVAFRYALRV